MFVDYVFWDIVGIFAGIVEDERLYTDDCSM